MGLLEQRQVEDERWRQQVDATLDEHRDQLAEFEAKFNRGNTRFADGEARMTRMEAMLGENNVMTAGLEGSVATLKTDLGALKDDTSLIVKWVKNATGFRNVMQAAGSFVLWLSIVLIACGVVWYVITQHRLPEPKKADLGVLVGALAIPRRKSMAPLAAAGTARPAQPQSVFAEDFSLLIRTPRRFRIARTKIRVLS